jgi:ApbE superfamily uncharacterized protein (UPF0280 family)
MCCAATRCGWNDRRPLSRRPPASAARPIDLIIEAFGASDEVERAYRQAIDCFGDILPTLVRELPALRRPVGDAYPLLQGPVARRMVEAVWPHRAVFITPMAAVAGAVADEMLQAMLADRALDKAYVNDGGDIAIHLAPGHSLRAGIFAQALDGAVTLTHDRPVRGIATSGRGGRSFSLGIADSATVLARTAAAADAAATLIANAVNVDHTRHRAPAGARARSGQRPGGPAGHGRGRRLPAALIERRWTVVWPRPPAAPARIDRQRGDQPAGAMETGR